MMDNDKEEEIGVARYAMIGELTALVRQLGFALHRDNNDASIIRALKKLAPDVGGVGDGKHTIASARVH
jgi:hypothetical protein